MGSGKVTAKRGTNGVVEYDNSKSRLGNGNGVGSNLPPGVAPIARSLREGAISPRAKQAALGELLSSEEAAVRAKTAALASGAVSVGGPQTSTSAPRGQQTSTSAPRGQQTSTIVPVRQQGAVGYSAASSSTSVPEGNPGIGDPEANADIDLSTSDTTARRKAGYRRGSGIRI